MALAMVAANGKSPSVPGLPLILDGNFFKVVSEEGLKVTGQCTFCPSRIMGLKTTTSNFNTHLKKMHPEKHKIYEEYKIERGQAIKKRRLSTEPNAHLNGGGGGGQRRIRPSLDMSHRYNGNGTSLNLNMSPQSAQSLLAGGRGRPKQGLSQNVLGGLIPRRRPSSMPSQVVITSTSSNQLPRLKPNPNSLLVPTNVQVTSTSASAHQLARSRRKELDDIVLNYVIQSLSSTSIVENPHFVNLVAGLTSSSKKLLSQKTLESKINMQSIVKKNEVLRLLSRSSYICVTLDMWALANEVGSTYACMTGHWVRDDLKVQSVLLNCRRFQNDPTCEKIVEYISEIMGAYNINRDKICCIVTNNGTNMLATRIYQISYLEDSLDAQNGLESIGSEGSESHGLSNEDLVFINVGNILSDYSNDDESNGLQLPSHYDCPTQTLISVLTSATFETLSNADHPTSYIFQTAINKCQLLWKAYGFREAAEKASESYGINIVIPDKHRWNSYLEAIFVLLNSREVLDDVFGFFLLQALDENELNFLEEYVRTLKPFMDALDVLQNDTDLFMGTFVPTIMSVKQSLEELAGEDLEYTKPLVDALLHGLQVPFNDIITLDVNARPLILASILHPYYKLSWIPEEKVEELRSWYLEEGMNAGKAAQPNDMNQDGPGNKKVRKSNGIKQTNGMDEEDLENDVGTGILLEFINYLETPCEQVGSKQLDKFPHVKKSFITFNTAIASSVPVERVINFTEICAAPSRALLKDEILENMMILKCN